MCHVGVIDNRENEPGEDIQGEGRQHMHAFAQQLTLADGGVQWLGVTFAAVLAIVVVGYAVLFIGALVSIARTGHDTGMKLAWIVFAFVAPFLGSLLWFLVGRRSALRQAEFGY